MPIEHPILTSIGEPNLEDELELKLRGSWTNAMLNLHAYLLEEYGVLFNMQVLEPLNLVSPGIWKVKLRVGRMKTITSTIFSEDFADMVKRLVPEDTEGV